MWIFIARGRGGGIFKLSGIGTTGIAALWNVTPEVRTWQDVERGTTVGQQSQLTR